VTLNAKRLAWLAGGVLLAYLGYGVYQAGTLEAPPPPSNPQIVFRGGSASGQRIRTRSWSAAYDRIVSNADQTVLDLENVHDGLIYRKGKPYLRVRAAHMTVNTVSRDFNVTGPMHVETVVASPPRSFDTTAASWSDAAQKLALTQTVTIRTGAATPLSVGSLTFDVKTGQLTIANVAGGVRLR
jgi:hypothetical protein